jgi:predicted CXXCH cytochrome family protein
MSMKKILFVLAFAFILTLALVGTASANGGPHGGYTATTDACAGCHRAHTATGPNLLIQTSTYALCMSCHGSAGTGADTNVADGFFLSTRGASTTGTAQTTDNAPLLAGGFTNYKGAAVTSKHDVALNGTPATAAAWGNGSTRGVATNISDVQFNCASCHDPHGSSNYRIVKTTVNGVAVAVAQVDEGAAKDYDQEHWSTGQSNLCSACHGAYHVTTAGSGSDAAMVATGGYTHRVGMSYAYGANSNPEAGFGGFTLPLAESGTNNTVACQTCHLPHGSSAAMTVIANGGPTGVGTLPGNTTATDSALLRLDNRGVCEVCHQK